ncbi:hypothetical protein FSP39_007849 [Pinctada imbricata]|uniref:C1q domain-containing protein n=1 Tax=Pinctada imbricata TaxID=66713 RepID=A0AA89BX05_PINIB|nr:hypothetical protein FSP39_007849 [Pinctada imbricata]
MFVLKISYAILFLFIVYFQAWNSVTQTNVPAGKVLVYDRVNSNEGNGYDTSSGKFTAPRGGPYVFTWTALTQDQYSLNVNLYVNGKNIGTAQADGAPGPQNSSGSNTVVLTLNEGDVVTLRVENWNAQEDRQFYGRPTSVSTFAGWTL